MTKLSKELLLAIKKMSDEGMNVHDFITVRDYLFLNNKFDMVEYIENNRYAFTTSIMNREYDYVGFYFE